MSILNTEKLKSLRSAAELTQEQAAKAAGFNTRQQWNEIESGRITNIGLDTLNRIADAVKCKPRDLLIDPAPRASLRPRRSSADHRPSPRRRRPAAAA